jgi:hypothetical protein
MTNLILIFFYLILGITLQRVKRFLQIVILLNKIVIYVCLPALALYFIPKIHWNNQLLFPIGVAWIGFVVAFFTVFGKNTVGLKN